MNQISMSVVTPSLEVQQTHSIDKTEAGRAAESNGHLFDNTANQYEMLEQASTASA